jgi:hypothetical protein
MTRSMKAGSIVGRCSLTTSAKRSAVIADYRSTTPPPNGLEAEDIEGVREGGLRGPICRNDRQGKEFFPRQPHRVSLGRNAAQWPAGHCVVCLHAGMGTAANRSSAPQFSPSERTYGKPPRSPKLSRCVRLCVEMRRAKTRERKCRR